MSLNLGIIASSRTTAAPSGIITNGLVLNLDVSNTNSYSQSRSFSSAKIYSVSNILRSSNYSVEWSDNNTTWTTEFSGVMSNNSSFGIQTGTITSSTPTGAHRYWRYIEGSAVVTHHPRCSRIILSTSTGDNITLIKYEDDNTIENGPFAIGTVFKDYVNTWNDLSTSSYVIGLFNSPSYSSLNLGSLIFNGTNNYGTFIRKQTLQNQNFTISLWIKPSTQSQSLITMFDDSHSAANQGWVIQSENATSNRNYYFAYWDGSQFQPAGNFGSGKGVQITNSVWQNIVYTKSGTSVKGFINGVEFVNYTATNSNTVYLTNYIIGIAAASSGGRYFNANISQILMYNTGLLSSEVLQNYNAIKSRYGL